MDPARPRRSITATSTRRRAQSTLADALGVQQAEISKIEKRTDVFVSTLRRFIQAMGGDLEIRAVFPDRSVTIRNFSSLAQEESRG